jgi:hypothetical protein
MSECEGAGRRKEDKEKRLLCKYYEAVSSSNDECFWLCFDIYCYNIDAQREKQ